LSELNNQEKTSSNTTNTSEVLRSQRMTGSASTAGRPVTSSATVGARGKISPSSKGTRRPTKWSKRTFCLSTRVRQREESSGSWIRAQRHITSQRELFSTYEEHHSRIEVGSAEEIEAIGKGNIVFQQRSPCAGCKGKLHLAPTHYGDWPSHRDVWNEVYGLQGKHRDARGNEGSGQTRREAVNAVKEVTGKLWHDRIGHLHARALQGLIAEKVPTGLQGDKLVCQSCDEAKISKRTSGIGPC